jgi:hypothetical protein
VNGVFLVAPQPVPAAFIRAVGGQTPLQRVNNLSGTNI